MPWYRRAIRRAPAMSGRRIRRATPVVVCSLVLMVGSATAPGAPHAAEPEPRTERAERVTRPAPLREPRNVHERLRAICADAGYRSADFDACAAAIGDACRRSGVPAETPGC